MTETITISVFIDIKLLGNYPSSTRQVKIIISIITNTLTYTGFRDVIRKTSLCITGMRNFK